MKFDNMVRILMEEPDLITVNGKSYYFKDAPITFIILDTCIVYCTQKGSTHWDIIRTIKTALNLGRSNFSRTREILKEYKIFIINPSSTIMDKNEFDELERDWETGAISKHAEVTGRIYDVGGQYHITFWENRDKVIRFRNSIEELLEQLHIDVNAVKWEMWHLKDVGDMDSYFVTTPYFFNPKFKVDVEYRELPPE